MEIVSKQGREINKHVIYLRQLKNFHSITQLDLSTATWRENLQGFPKPIYSTK